MKISILILCLLLTSCNWFKSNYIEDEFLAQHIREEYPECITSNNKLTSSFYNLTDFRILNEISNNEISFTGFSFANLEIFSLHSQKINQNTNFNFTNIKQLRLHFNISQNIDNLDLTSSINLEHLHLTCNNIINFDINLENLSEVWLRTENKSLIIKMSELLKDSMMIESSDLSYKLINIQNYYNYDNHKSGVYYNIRYANRNPNKRNKEINYNG